MHSHRIADTSDTKWTKCRKSLATLERMAVLGRCPFLLPLRHNVSLSRPQGRLGSKHLADWLLSLIDGVFLIGFGCLIAIGVPLRNRFDRKNQKNPAFGFGLIPS